MSGNSIPHALSRSRKVYATAESTFGTYVEPKLGGTDELKVLNLSIDGPIKEREIRMDARSSRSALERFSKKTNTSWELTCYAMGSGSANTSPDIEPLLNSLFETNDGSGTFTLDEAYDGLGCFSLCEFHEGVFIRQLTGCVVTEATFSAEGGEAPTWTFSGRAKDHILGGRSTLKANPSASDVIDVGATDVLFFDVGAIIALSDDYGLGSDGYKVSAKSDSAGTLTLVNVSDDSAATLAGTVATDTVVIPYAPTQSTLGSPISGTLGSLTLTPSGFSAITVPVTACEITINNNLTIIEDEAFQETITGFIPGRREISGTLDFRIRRDLLTIIGARNKLLNNTLALTIGNTAGSRMVWSLKVELDFSGFESPDAGQEAGELTISVPFMAVATSAENELSLDYT